MEELRTNTFEINVYWRCFINSTKISVAEMVYAEIEKQFSNTQKNKIEKYWKDDSLIELTFSQSVTMQGVELLTHKLLNYAKYFSSSWELQIPGNLDNNYEDFSGISNKGLKNSSISWISFSL